MSFQGPDINKLDGVSGTGPADKSRVIGLIMGGVAASGLALNTPARIVDPSQAEDLGIDESYDANNSLLVYDHIKEIFRISPETELIFMLAERPDGTAGNELTDFFEDDGEMEAFLKDEKAKDVKALFVVFNPDGIAFTFTNNGYADEVLACQAKAQLMVDKFASDYKRYIDTVMLSAIEIDTVAGLEDLRAGTYGAISICSAVDGYVEDNYTAFPDKVAIGAAAGAFAVRQINEDLGSAEVIDPPAGFKGQETYPLDNGVRWPYAALPNGDNINQYSLTIQEDMASKGCIFVGSFPDYDGFYFSGDPTCVALSSDFAWINRNCVWNAAARIVRQALIPKVRSVLKRDPDTGFLRRTTTAALEQKAIVKLENELGDFTSGLDVTIDPEQTPNATTPLKALVQVVYDGILYSFEIDLGLFANIQEA